MNPVNLRILPRRRFLRSGAICLGLPLLDAMLPRCGRAAERAREQLPKSLVLVGRGLGVHGEHFFPADTGPNYQPSRALRILEPHRARLTVFSGLSHPGYPNTHHTEAGLFTGVSAERIEKFEHLRNTISLDQLVAQRWQGRTRFSSVVMGGQVTTPMSYDAQGVAVSSETKPSETFRRLFLDGAPNEVQRELSRLREGRSILDGLLPQLQRLQQQLGPRDRDRVEQMATTVRTTEQELLRSEAWVMKPKPRVARKVEDFEGARWSSGQRMRYDLAALALQTDSTRVAISTETVGAPGEIEGSNLDQHDASHHGKDPAKLEQFAKYEDEETRNFGLLLDKLSQSAAGDLALLDRTIVLWASNLGNPSSHASVNLPILVAGGGFKHRGHVRYEADRQVPLSNLYLRILNHLELDEVRFGASTGILTDLG